MIKIESNFIDDGALIEQLNSGSKKAFSILFDRYWESALENAFKRTKDLEASKDIVQEIFSRIWINRETHINNFPAYLSISIRNRTLKLLAKQKSIHPFFDALENLEDHYLHADAGVLWKEFYQSYEELLETLPPKRRNIFYLRIHQDLSTNTIADELGISKKTVQNQLGKAIETLRLSLIRFIPLGILVLLTLR